MRQGTGSPAFVRISVLIHINKNIHTSQCFGSGRYLPQTRCSKFEYEIKLYSTFIPSYRSGNYKEEGTNLRYIIHKGSKRFQGLVSKMVELNHQLFSHFFINY